jgi:polyisoprenoid-binding protein YceI
VALDGELTFGQTTRPVSFAVTFGGTEDTPGGGPRRAGFEARAQLSRADFGIAPTFPSAVLGQDIAVEIDLQLVEP